jgi:hypothetical protein
MSASAIRQNLHHDIRECVLIMGTNRDGYTRRSATERAYSVSPAKTIWKASLRNGSSIRTFQIKRVGLKSGIRTIRNGKVAKDSSIGNGRLIPISPYGKTVLGRVLRRGRRWLQSARNGRLLDHCATSSTKRIRQPDVPRCSQCRRADRAASSVEFSRD